MTTSRRTRNDRAFALALALTCGACVGTIGGDDEPTYGAGGGATGPAGARSGADALGWPVVYDGTPSALRRLSRDEIVATMEALTGTAPARDDLPAEPRPKQGPLLTGGLSYVATEVPKLETLIAGFSAKIAPSMRVQSGCKSVDQAQRDCLLAWARAFGERALRRPLRGTEDAALRAVLASADGTSDADTGAVAAVLHATFFSPSFLYRAEIGAPVPGQGASRALSGDEIATRLGFLATLAPPDAELLAAGRAGRLADGGERARQFDRLSRTEAGKHAEALFVMEWLGANEPKVRTKSASYRAGLPADFEASIRASADAFVRDVLSGPTPTVEALLTSDAYLGDPAVKAVMAPAGSSTTATGDTADTGRGGLLMHPHVLAAHTKEDGASPFQLGVFMREALLCERIGPPPPNAAAAAPKDHPPGLTLRETFQYRISVSPGCLACHAQFAPFGYAFLPFDPVGRWMKSDPTGKPWDLTGNATTYSGEKLAFASPRALAHELGTSPQVHGCFAQTALEWALGRKLVEEDERLIVALDDVVRRTDGNVLELLRALVSAPEFSTVVAPR